MYETNSQIAFTQECTRYLQCGLMICLGSGPSGFNCWTSVAPAFQSWFAVEYSSCFISVMNLDLYVRCFDSLMSKDPSRGPNNFYVYTNHS